jgi:hypothetical protein
MIMRIKMVCFFLLWNMTLVFFEARAQFDRNIISVSGGYSLPVGEFASSQLGSTSASLAGSGYYGSLALERKFTPWIGVRLSGNLNINSTNSQPILDKANSVLEQVRPMIGETGNYTWETNVSKWRLCSAMIGPAVYLKMGSVSLMGHVSGGMVHVKSPVIELYGTSSNDTNPIDALLMSDQNTVMGVGAGLGIRIPFSDRVALQISGDWVVANAQLNQISLRATVGSYPEVVQLISEQKLVGVVNIGAGLAFSF